MVKKLILTILLLVVVLVGWWTMNKDKTGLLNGESIKIGAIMPLSGNLAYFGDSYSTGAQLALEEINNSGGINGKKLELVLSDNQEDPERTVRDFYEMTSQQKIKFLLVPMTRPALAIRDLADQNDVIVLLQTITPVGSKRVFKDFYSVESLAREISALAFTKQTRAMCLFTLQTNDGERLADEFQRDFVARGGKVLLTEKFPRTAGQQLDYQTPLLKARQRGCDGIFAFLLPNNLPTLVDQMISQNMGNLKFYTVQIQDPAIMTDKLRANLSKLSFVASSWFSVDPNKNGDFLAFRDRYKKRFRKEPKGDTAYTYDDIKVLANALRICDKAKALNSECVAEELLKIKDYSGAAGRLSFAGNPNSSRDIFIEVLSSGRR